LSTGADAGSTMLVKLPYGVCVKPDTVKMIHVRTVRKQETMVHTVTMKTEDDGFQIIASFDSREEAETLSAKCARLVIKGLGEGDEGEEEEKEEEDDFDDDDDDDLAKKSASQALLDDPLDW
jgi:hypothetical protein